MKFFNVQERLHRVRAAIRRNKLNSSGKPRQRLVASLVTLAVVASMVTMAAWPTPTSASYTNVLYNGSFEQGFTSQAGCGMVGAGWQCFTNGGAANYGFYDDQWDRTVFDGKHSQLIEINTKGIMVGDADRYAGIYQTVQVVNWANYTLSLEGMIRTTMHDGDPWRYRIQVGWSAGPYADWTRVTNWQDIGLDNYWDRTEPHGFFHYSTNLTAQADTMTVYVRAWKKWGVPNEEIDINLDALALHGPSPLYWQHPVAPVQPVPPSCVEPCGPTPVHPVQPIAPVYPPVQPGCVDPCRPLPPPPSDLCLGPNLVYNGDFEAGFYPVSVGHVGTGWGYFITGGGANYGFYDDQWPRVRADGHSSQLIEINTKNIYPLENDRYAGIFQYLRGWCQGRPMSSR
ncbi:MAG: hypothetical protein IPK16_14945 [Anaerolineales bacterium]|nr:hypothetical protein [Anaerolineales bacterium]